MELGSFFIELLERADEALDSMSADKKLQSSQSGHLYGFLYFLRILILEFQKPASERNLDQIHSAWSQVKSFGNRLRFFEKYQGDEILRDSLLQFLNGEVKEERALHV